MTARLREDARTAELIDRIAALDAGHGREHTRRACSPDREEVTAATLTPDPGELPNGVYRVEFSDDYLADHGLAPDSVAGNHGVWTTVLDDGRWSVEQVATGHQRPAWRGIYQVPWGGTCGGASTTTPPCSTCAGPVTDDGVVDVEEVPRAPGRARLPVRPPSGNGWELVPLSRGSWSSDSSATTRVPAAPDVDVGGDRPDDSYAVAQAQQSATLRQARRHPDRRRGDHDRQAPRRFTPRSTLTRGRPGRA